MPGRILVINPNSSDAVTAEISAAVEPLRFAGGPRVDCVTLSEGPPGIESQRDSDGVILPLCGVIERHAANADAFVIACYSDPGLASAREVTDVPVFGIGQAAMSVALTRGDKFGVISILSRSIPRHRRYVTSLGLSGRMAGDLTIELGVAELGNEKLVERRMTEVGAELTNAHGADVLIMGCAGMARYRGLLEQRLGVPVIDPNQAAVGLALQALQAATAEGCSQQNEQDRVVGI